MGNMLLHFVAIWQMFPYVCKESKKKINLLVKVDEANVDTFTLVESSNW